MPSLPTLPRRSRLERASFLFAGALTLIGLAGTGGSWLHLDWPSAGPASAVTMVPEEALCFLIFGIVLFAREQGWRPAEWLAALPAALGLLRIAESLFTRELRVDALFSATNPAETGSHTLRFAAMTAACLALGGGTMAWHAARVRLQGRQIAEAAVGSVLAAIGCATLFGYASGLAAFTSWGTATAMPASTAAALLVLGLALLVVAWREKIRKDGQPPAWAPLPMVAGCLTLTLILWIDLREHERENLNARTKLEMDRLVTATNAIIDRQVSAVERFAQSWSDAPETEWSEAPLGGLAPGSNLVAWESDAAIHKTEMDELNFVSLSYLDSALRTQRVFPHEGNEGKIGFNHGADRTRSNAAGQALESGHFAVSGSIEVMGSKGPERGYAIYSPVRHNGRAAGFASAESPYPELFARITGGADDQLKNIAANYSVAVSIGSNLVYQNTVTPAVEDGVTLDRTYTIYDRHLHLTFIPSEILTHDERSLPDLVLAVGVVISALLGLSVYLALRARSGQFATELSNQRLRGEIDERRRIEVQLKHAKTEAEAGSRAKSEFLASMSHEIRTPMNGVIGMASLLMETKLTVEQRDYVNTIRASGDALLTIINEILDFSKIESGKMEIEHHPFELAPCVEETLDLFGVQAAAKRLELACHIAADVPPWIVGDVTRLRQVMANLVNNAIKFTPGGSVTVDVKRCPIPAPAEAPARPAPSLENDEEEEEDLEDPIVPAITLKPSPLDPSANPNLIALEFSVRDTGIGIPPERMDRLFKAFSQVDSSTTRKYGGTGLGLAICQRLCQLMGGSIRVESVAGRGSAFIFNILTEKATTVANADTLPPLPAPLRGATVLCVEDLPINQARLRTVFEAWGARCVIAADAPAAKVVAATLRPPPALLLVDYDGMAEPSPLDVLAALPCPRLVMFPFGQTAPAPPRDGPAFDSISKPLKTGLLMHAIAGLFGPRRHDVGVQADTSNRLLAEEFPLEVLLAEDNAVNQKVALRFLERLGYRADVANNGQEAVNMLELRRYDLVLMDMQMPEMDGLEASRQVRRRLPRERQPKIIALTANAMKGDRELCIAAGMDDHVSKPVKMEEIAAAIRRHFTKKPALTR